MYICNKCRSVTDELPTGVTYYPYGEREVAVEESVTDCRCGGEFVEACVCAGCGEWCTKDEIQAALCPECFTQTYTPEYVLSHDMHEFLDWFFGDNGDHGAHAARQIRVDSVRRRPARAEH